MANEPFLFPPPWSTDFAVSLNILRKGIKPLDFPLVDLILLPPPLILCACKPMPPAVLDIKAQSLIVLKIPSIESSSIPMRKQDDNCCIFRPLLNRVGVACV